MSITWRTVTAPNQSGANQLASQGATTVTQGLQALGQALGRPQEEAKAEQAQQFAQAMQLAGLDQGQQRLDNQDRQHTEDQALRKFLQQASFTQDDKARGSNQQHAVNLQGSSQAHASSESQLGRDFQAGQTDKKIKANAVESKADREQRQLLHNSTQNHSLKVLGLQQQFTESERKAMNAYDTLARNAGYKHAKDMQNNGFTFENGKLVKMNQHEVTMWDKGNDARVKAAALKQTGAEALQKSANANQVKITGMNNATSIKNTGTTVAGANTRHANGLTHTTEENKLGRKFTSEENRLGRVDANNRATNAVQATIDGEKRRLANSKALADHKAKLATQAEGSKPNSKAAKANSFMKSPTFTKTWEREAPHMNSSQQANFLGMSEVLAERYGDNTATMTGLIGQLHDGGYIDSDNLASSPNGYEAAVDELVKANAGFVNRGSGGSITPAKGTEPSKTQKAAASAKDTIAAKRAARRAAQEKE